MKVDATRGLGLHVHQHEPTNGADADVCVEVSARDDSGAPVWAGFKIVVKCGALFVTPHGAHRGMEGFAVPFTPDANGGAQ